MRQNKHRNGGILALIAFLFIFTAACAGPASESSDSVEEGGKLNVVVTTTHLSDLARDIGGGHVEVTGLMGPGVDPHGYEPAPSDIEAIRDADLVGYNGLHLEAMFVDIFEKMRQTDSNIFALEDAISEEDVLDYKYEGKDLEKDPHIWFDIDLWKASARLVADEFSRMDPEHEADYQANYEDYVVRLDELEDYIEDKVAELPEDQRILITAHDAFSYFGENYGFQVEGIQGINSQTEAGTADISLTADLVADKGVKACFIESSVSDRNIQALIEAVEVQGAAIEIGGELFSDALGTEEENAGNYFDAYRTNVDTIVDSLK